MGRRRRGRRRRSYSPKRAAYVYGIKACPWCGKVSFRMFIKKGERLEDGIVQHYKEVKCLCLKCGFQAHFEMPTIYDKPDAYSFVVDLIAYYAEFLTLPNKTRFRVFSVNLPETPPST